MSEFRVIDGGVLAAKGFTAAATHCGIKPEALDLVLIHSALPAVAAATLTQNRFRAAPTYVTGEAVASGHVRTIVVNSGNANCATGEQGLADARRMASLAGEATGVPADEVIVCSTGKIGKPLPMDKLEAGIPKLATMLGPDNAELAAKGILTTDTHPKSCAVEFEVGSVTCRIGAICKGAGMIAPNMATMLCFVCSDVAIEAPILRETLSYCVARSFNCVSVDGDMSTNDTVAVLANGAAENPVIAEADSPGYEAFRAALLHVTQDLAKQIAFDGEGSGKDVTISVTGGKDYEHAREIGRAIARYNEFRTMLYGQSFNWGRIAAAMGASLLDVDPTTVTIKLQGILTWDRGRIAEYDAETGADALKAGEIQVDVDLGCGDGEATVWTCDMTPTYIALNV